MIDALVRSAIFGVRNVDKVHNGDTGRCAAAGFQLYNAGKAALDSATKLDNAIGKGAQTAVTAMKTISKSDKAINTAAKVVKLGSENVNFLLCCAAGYRILKSNNKEKAVKKELWGMSTMFGVEHLMREGFNSKVMQNFKNGVNNKYLKAGISILEGILFVMGSITASNLGYKIGESLYEENSKLNKKYDMEKIKLQVAAEKSNKNNNSGLEKFAKENLKVDENEFFVHRETIA